MVTGDWLQADDNPCLGTENWGDRGKDTPCRPFPISPSPIFPNPSPPVNHTDMIVSMPVIPSCVGQFQNFDDLHQFLLNCQQGLTTNESTKILSISLEIPPLDPLVILRKFYRPEQLHFYFEKKETHQRNGYRQDLAIVAFDQLLSLNIEGSERFFKSQKFIESVLTQSLTLGDTHLPFTGPHFFCSFTFFDENLKSNAHFSPATVFLPKWQIVRQNHQCVMVINTQLNSSSNLQQMSHQIWTQMQAILSVSVETLIPFDQGCSPPHQIDFNNPHQFQKSVLASLDFIRENHFTKIVLSHAIDVFSKTPFSLTDSLNNLRTLYPDCYIFSTSNGQGQTFMGASPERLISIQNHHLITDALAGSAPRGKTAGEDRHFSRSLLSSEKDLHEHQVVIDFILQKLINLGLSPDYFPSPYLLQLSNIQHLWTPITAKVSPHIHLLEILAELHPTPAVAGFPRDIAQQQIRYYENFDRCLFAAPLGWIDHQGNGEFLVGIRSALINGNLARLYAGAGIVAGSEPDKEFAEIQLKFQPLLNALV